MLTVERKGSTTEKGVSPKHFRGAKLGTPIEVLVDGRGEWTPMIYIGTCGELGIQVLGRLSDGTDIRILFNQKTQVREIVGEDIRIIIGVSNGSC